MSLKNYFWEIWCVASVIGIWPRYIEPNLISVSKMNLKVPNLPRGLHGLKVVQFSDLHWKDKMSPRFLNKIIQKIDSLEPDVILFTGDAISYGELNEPETLQDFLCTLHAKYGCFAILGNHDYNEYVSVNDDGDYDVGCRAKSALSKGFKRFFSNVKLTKKVTERAKNVPFNERLIECFKNTPFILLHNETKVLSIKNCSLNITGLGEHMLGRCDPSEAFQNYDTNGPGIIMLHNPDGLKALQEYPGNIVLCGHTHGGQINLPGLVNKFMYLENPALKRGIKKSNHHWVYVNRGIGSIMPFRWFSTPELLCLTLEASE